MPINSTDVFLVNSDGLSYQVAASDLKDASGEVLVNRGTSSYRCNISDLANKLRDEDLMLVNRGNFSYKIKGKDVLKDVLLPEPYRLTGLGWTGSPTEIGSDLVRESTFYAVDPNVGCVFTPQSNISRLDISVSRYGKYYKVTNVIYHPWSPSLAGGFYNSASFSVDRYLETFVNKDGNDDQLLDDRGSIKKLPFDTRTYTLTPQSEKLYTKNLTFANLQGDMAIAGFEVFGYEVDANGTLIRD